MDRIESLARAVLPVGILGNTQTADFELVDLATVPLPAARCRELHARGLVYLGAAGLVDGKPWTALDEPLDDATVTLLAQAYVAHVVSAMRVRTTPVA